MLNPKETHVEAFQAFVPVLQEAGTVVPGVDVTRVADNAQNDAQSALMVVNTGAIAGAPDDVTITVKLQHKDSGGAYADYTDPTTGAVPTITMTADSSPTELAPAYETLKVNLSAAKAIIGVHVTVAFTAGTTPSVALGCVLCLDGYKQRA